MNKKRALNGMSGGVDSSVAAFLTGQAGYECIGATMRLYDKSAACGAPDDAEDARSVAEKLNIPHHILSFQEQFAQ